MAVYSYTSSVTLNTIRGYAKDLFGAYPGYFASNYNPEKKTFNYNKQSIVDYDVWDYGSIINSITESEDFGEITATIELWYQIQDYGTLEVNTTRIPYGSLNFTEFADSSLIRVSVGGVQFALFGRSATQVIFNPVNRIFDIEGTAYSRFTSAMVGNGIIKLPRIISTGSVGFTPPESVFLLKFFGTAQTEPLFPEGDRVFNIIGTSDESATYDYNDSSRIDFATDDYGFISETVLRTEDYGLISENQNIERWNTGDIEDHGLIIESATISPFGIFGFSGFAKEVFSKSNYTGSGIIKVQGQGFGRPTPRQNGGGFITITGTPTVRIRLRYFASGSLFGFSSTSESKSIQTEQEGVIKLTGHVEENFSKGNYSGSGSAFSFISAAQLNSSVETSKQVLFKFAGTSKDVIRMRYFASGSLFGFAGAAERVAFAYNESSIVNVEQYNYGFVSEGETFQEDYGDITGDPYYPWQNDNYGGLIPDKPQFPYGVTKLISTTLESETKIYIGSTNISLHGTAKVFVLPKHNGTGTVNLSGFGVERNTENYVGSGSIFTFISKSESTSVVEQSQELFKFTGSLVERFGKGNYDGSGSIFTFNSNIESSSNTQETSGLFKFTGSVVERNTENYVGSGSLFGFVGSAERVAFAYNQSSIYGVFENYDYGFIDESPIICATINDYADELISDYADEIASEFGCLESAVDYGLVSEYHVPYYDDYGLLFPDETGRPYGFVRFIGSANEKSVENYDGSGSLFSFINGIESVTPITYIGSGKIAIGGTCEEKVTPATHIGSGSIFTFISKTETTSVSEISTELFKIGGSAYITPSFKYPASGTITINGEARIYVLPIHNGSGTFKIRGKGLETVTPATHIGKGRIYGFSSATKSLTIRAKTSTELFRISGSAKQKFKASYIGTGKAQYSGNATTIFRLKVIGKGRIAISNNAKLSFTKGNYTGKGSIFAFSSTTKSLTIRTKPTTELFTINGSAVERFAESYVGSTLAKFSSSATTIFRLRVTKTGLQPIKIIGDAVEKNVESYIGNGRIYGFRSATVSKSNAESSKELFKITGRATARLSFVPAASGLIKVSGNATERYSPAHAGSGSIFTFKSTTTSRSTSETSKELFRVTGHATESFTKGNYTGTGSIFTFVSFTETRRVSEFSTVLFELSGSAIQVRGKSYLGRGSLFGFSSTTQSTTYKPSQTTKTLNFTGKAKESFTKGNYTGTGSIFTFVSSTQTKTISEFSTTLFKLSGSANQARTIFQTGSGTLKLQSKSITGFSLRVISVGSLLRINGKCKESFTWGLYNGDVETMLVGKSRTRNLPFSPGQPTKIYVI